LLQKEKLFRILSFRSFMLVHQRPIVSKTLARTVGVIGLKGCSIVPQDFTM